MKSRFRWKGVSMITDFETWLLDVGFDRTFRLLEYRRPGDWTPYEMEKRYIDESHYRDNHYPRVNRRGPLFFFYFIFRHKLLFPIFFTF